MTVTGFVVWFIFMAATTMTILVVGTLGAADLLHRRHNTAGGRPDGESIERQPERAKARQDAHLVDALMPLGSSLPFDMRLEPPPAVDTDRDDKDPHQGAPSHEDSRQGRAA